MHGSKGGVGGYPTEKFKCLYIYVVKLAKIYLGPPSPGKHEYPSDHALEYFFNFLDLRMNIILAFPQKNN